MYKMIIVDDEPLTREYMKQNIPLINELWQVTAEAMDGHEALEIIEKQEFDLIITDIKMPVMDGLEFCRIASEKFPKQNIIILSGYDEFAFAKEAMRYGVHEYLLKPIVMGELQSTLNKITLKIENEKNEQLTYRAMLTLSEDSKKQVIKNFLKAVISTYSVETESLYPLISRLRVSLVESEGIIMILALDEDIILQKSIPLNDIPVLKFVLNQIATEIVEDDKIGWVFLDSEENTSVLLTGENEAEVLEMCTKIYFKISSKIYGSTGITVTGAVGIPVSDVLQLNTSYDMASDMLLNQLVFGGNSIYTYQDNKEATKFISDLDKVLFAIKSGLLDNNEMDYSVSVTSFVELIDCFTLSPILKFGIHMIESIVKLKPEFSSVFKNAALKMLQTRVLNEKHSLTKDNVTKIFKDIVKLFADNVLQKDSIINEHDVVLKAKEYIYTHYSEPISLDLIAEKLSISSCYLSNIFHKSVGESYIKFLTRVRMEQAARLLKSTSSWKVYDVSEKVGYISVKHFSYVFKHHFNMTPGEYQDRYLNTPGFLTN